MTYYSTLVTRAVPSFFRMHLDSKSIFPYWTWKDIEIQVLDKGVIVKRKMADGTWLHFKLPEFHQFHGMELDRLNSFQHSAISNMDHDAKDQYLMTRMIRRAIFVLAIYYRTGGIAVPNYRRVGVQIVDDNPYSLKQWIAALLSIKEVSDLSMDISRHDYGRDALLFWVDRNRFRLSAGDTVGHETLEYECYKGSYRVYRTGGVSALLYIRLETYNEIEPRRIRQAINNLMEIEQGSVEIL